MPLALLEAKRLFLHIPKTGGNWVIEAVKTLGIPYAPVGGGESFDDSKNTYPNYQRFTTVRNPLTWYASYWANCKIFGCGGLGCLEISDSCRENLHSFPSFMNQVLQDYPGFLTRLYAQYIKPGVQIMFTESLLENLCTVLDGAGAQYDKSLLVVLEHQNRCASQPKYAGLISYPGDMRSRIMDSENQLFEQYPFERIGEKR